MNRGLLALIAALLVAGVATANAPPPPVRSIPTDHKITTETEYPDHDFYLVGEKVVAVTLDPKKPIELSAKPGDSYEYTFVAIPKGAGKKFESEKEFHAALRKGDRIKGQVEANTVLRASAVLLTTDRRDRLVQEHKVEKIEARAVVLTTKTIEPTKDGEKKPAPGKAPNPPGVAPLASGWIAGLAAFAALTLGGLWVVGRGRRKV